jgi:hypothetical protein
MTALAGLITFLFTAVLTIVGVGAAFVLIPVFIALGVEVHTAMATALLLNALAMSVASVKFIRGGLVVWRVAVPDSSGGCWVLAAATSSCRPWSGLASTRRRPRPPLPSW